MQPGWFTTGQSSLYGFRLFRCAYLHIGEVALNKMGSGATSPGENVMGIQDWFRRDRGGRTSKTPFDDWPLPPPLQIPTVGRIGLLEALPAVNRPITLNPDKYPPALIIGLGPTGEQVVRAWLARLSQDPAGPQKQLRYLLVTYDRAQPLPTTIAHGAQFDLHEVALGQSGAEHDATNPRNFIRQLLREPYLYEKLAQFLTASLGELEAASRERGLRILLVASAVEREVGLVGDILQLLLTPRRSPYAVHSLLLSLDSPQPTLDVGEGHAVLRELGRFTFTGSWHWLPASSLRGATDGANQDAFLDLIFLLEATNTPALNLKAVSFAEGVGQAITETVAALIHPAAREIWEQLRNDLGVIGAAREEAHLAFVQSLGVATLYVPLQELKEYIAARLAYAALFGEPPARDVGVYFSAEGLLPQHASGRLAEPSPGVLAREWFREAHPLFRWVLSANGPTYFNQLPARMDFTPFAALLSASVASGIMATLNDTQQPQALKHIAVELQWLHAQLKQAATWLAQSRTTQSQERTDLDYQLQLWQQTAAALLDPVLAWQTTLLAGETRPEVQRSGAPGVGEQSLVTNWRIAIKSTAPVASHSQSSPKTETPFSSVQQALRMQRTAAESALQAIAGGVIACPLTADGKNGLEEAERHYIDTIRPELNRYEMPTSQRFERVRERLAWCVEVPKSAPPRLILVCLPANVNGNGVDKMPPAAAWFSPQDGQHLTQTVLAVARNQVQDLDQQLIGSWMTERLQNDRFKDFLTRASRPFLGYDVSKATALYSNVGIPRCYLIGRDANLTGPYRRSTFPNVSQALINDVSQGEPTHLTALGFRLNLPLDAIETYRHAYEVYNHRPEHHLYPQERLVNLYESRLSTIGKANYSLPPDLTLALVDGRSVTLFCQACFCGFVAPRETDGLTRQRHWSLAVEFDADNRPLRWEPLHDLSLDADRYRGQSWWPLYLALRRFVLEAPYLESIARQPMHAFNLGQREQFLKELHGRVRAVRDDAALFSEQWQQFETTYLKPWRDGLRRTPNRLGTAFLDMLEIEKRQPVWSGWSVR